MIDNVTLKFAVSALALGTTMVACKPAASNYRPNSASAQAPVGQEAAAFYATAKAMADKGAFAQALSVAEQAVELAPRDSGYRMLLGDLYLKNGRFQSAETSFGDVLSLDPNNNRAALNRVLAQIALGRTGAAIAALDAMSSKAPPADIGLAYALAGEAGRAVAMLEPAARAPGATARVRQNLALAYALAGDWEQARIIASQDVAPADLAGRLAQWAAFAQPRSSADQVASLLSVTPMADGGQPVRLALAPSAGSNRALAEVTAEAAPAMGGAAPPEEAPVQYAAADAPTVSAPISAEAQPAAEPETLEAEQTRPVYSDAVQALVAPHPSAAHDMIPVVLRQHRFEAAPRAVAARPRAVRAGTGRYVVQLGAFSSASSVERAWSQAYRRYGFTDNVPLSTTVKIAGRGTFHRLSVAGFGSQGEARSACQSVKAKGGACFVRVIAGDAPVQWASRYTSRHGA